MSSEKPQGQPASQEAPRRRALLGTVAAAAGLAGVGLAWWRHEPEASAQTDPLWAMRFEAPAGAPAVEMAKLRGQPLLLNFWATWCPPCVEELPLLDGFFKQNKAKGWQVIGLAIDQPTAVKAFLDRLPLSFPIGLAGLDGTALGRSLGNLAGGLPFTVVFDRQGQVVQRKMGRVSPQDLAAWTSLT